MILFDIITRVDKRPKNPIVFVWRNWLRQKRNGFDVSVTFQVRNDLVVIASQGPIMWAQ